MTYNDKDEENFAEVAKKVARDFAKGNEKFSHFISKEPQDFKKYSLQENLKIRVTILEKIFHLANNSAEKSDMAWLKETFTRFCVMFKDSKLDNKFSSQDYLLARDLEKDLSDITKKEEMRHAFVLIYKILQDYVSNINSSKDEIIFAIRLLNVESFLGENLLPRLSENLLKK